MRNSHFPRLKSALAAILICALMLPGTLALNAFAENGDEVALTGDSTEPVTVNAGENKILDLAGHTLSAAVTNYGTLTIIDSAGGGKIGFTTNAGDVQAAVQNYGTLTLDGAALEVIGTGDLTQATGIYNHSGASMSMKAGSIEVVTNGTYWCYGIINEGTVTEISGGEISAIKNNTSTALNIMCVNNRNGGVVELISGGSMYTYHKGNGGESIGIRNTGDASVTLITGGSIWAECESTGSCVAYGIKNDGGTVGEVAGGTITAYSKGRDYCFGIRNSAGSTVKKISGGLIQAYMMHTEQAPNSIAIANWGRIDEITGGTMYAESINHNGTIIGLRNQNDTASVGKITGGNFIAKVTGGTGCKAFGIYNQGGSIDEIEDGLFYGYSSSGEWAFGLWNAAVINTISGGTFAAVIEHTDNAPNAIGLSNDGTISTITGGVYYAVSTHPTGGTFAIRNKKTISNISGGALYNGKTQYDFLFTDGGSTAISAGYALTDPNSGAASSESGYKYIIPSDATVTEAYTDSDLLKFAAVTGADGSVIATYRLYGTALNVASANNTPYPSIEEAAQAAGEGGTVTILCTIPEAVTLPADLTVTIDLDGHTIADLTVDGKATLTDSAGSGKITSLTVNGTASIESGIYGAVMVNGSLTVSGGIINGPAAGTGSLLLSGGAYIEGLVLPSQAEYENGCSMSEPTQNGYTYVTRQNAVILELCDGDELLETRIYEEGRLISSIGSSQKDGYVLAGWSTEKNGKPTIADDATASLEQSAALYGSYLKQPLFFFLGSSVTYGHATGGSSFIEEIAELYSIAYQKEAVSGTTLVDNGSGSYIQRMLTNFSPDASPDLLLVQLSTNDATQNKPLGSISESTDMADFDTSTVMGAMEYIIAYAKETWGCKVAFYTNPKYSSSAYVKMIEALYQLQEKWDIQIIDFYYYKNMEALSDSTLSSYMADSIHPNAQGYKWMAGILGEALLAEVHSEHDGVHVHKAPSCTEAGGDEFTCAICHQTFLENEIEATGHQFENGSCIICGEADPSVQPPETDAPTTEPDDQPVTEPDDQPTDDPDDQPNNPVTGDSLIGTLAVSALTGACFWLLLSKKKRAQ